MGKIRSGLRGWGRDIAESVRFTANTAMRSARKSRLSRRLAGSHSFMNEDLTEREREGLLMLWFGALVSGVAAARMGILFELLVGIGVGVAIIATWERKMERRRSEREVVAASVALPGEIAKEYEGYERVEWLNKLLQRAWPYVVLATEVARPTIRDCLEPWLEEYRLGLYQVIRELADVQRVEKYFPAEEVITCLHVNSISLGSTPPTIQGVKIHPLRDGKIVCHVRVDWQSDSHIDLGVGTDAGIAPYILENVKMSTTVRLMFRITESRPILAAIVATIPAERKPILDFDLSKIESPMAVPKGLTKQVRNLLTNFTNNSVLWPHRLVLPTTTPKKGMDLSDLYLRLHGQLSVAAIRGENLVNLYPYVIVFCRHQFKVRTKSVENTHDPTWNEEFILDVEDPKTQSVMFQVMNENKGDDELVGTVSYSLNDLTLDQDVELKLKVKPLKEKKRSQEEEEADDGNKKTYGSLSVELRYHVYTDLERKAAMKDEQHLIWALSAPDEPDSYETAIDLIHPY